MVERLVERHRHHGEDTRHQELSHGLSSLSLTRADVRAYARIFGKKDLGEAAQELMRLGVKGSEINSQRGLINKTTRFEAATAILTPLAQKS